MARTAVKVLSKEKKRRDMPTPGPPPKVPVETVKKTNWPSSPEDNPGAKCYVCSDIISKGRMIRIGQNGGEQGTDRYIWRCDSVSCAPGGSKWKKHFLGKSEWCRYYLSSLTKAEVLAMPLERQQDIGKLLVKHKVELIDRKIMEGADKKKRSKKNAQSKRGDRRLPVPSLQSQPNDSGGGKRKQPKSDGGGSSPKRKKSRGRRARVIRC